MGMFANKISIEEIGHQLGDKLPPWRTLVEILYKSKSHEEMLWYINQTHKNGWSRNMVLNQFELKAYERSLIEPNTSTPIKSDDLTKELFKDTYVFDFIDKNKINNEKDLKNSLVDNVIKFIQELGSDFAFVGKEYKLVVPGDDEFYIDILMYHLKIHAYIVIEVKSGKFKPQDLGQLLFYVNAIDKLTKTNIDDNTIGLLLCLDSNEFVAKTSLESINNRIGISKYKFIDDITNYLNNKLKNRLK